jgi:hypothetical protein
MVRSHLRQKRLTLHINRRQAVGALIGIPAALATRARAQAPQMDIRIIEGVIAVGGGIYNAIKAGISPLNLNTDDMLGMYCGLIEQLRRYGGSDDYLNAYMSAPPTADPDYIYSLLIPHYGSNPNIQATLRNVFYNLPSAAPGMYQTLFAEGGHDGFNNSVAGTFQYYEDIRGAQPRALKAHALSDDPECAINPDLCFPPPDPCTFDPLSCFPPWGPIPGVALPWADPNDPKTPKPRHGLTQADVCWFAGKAQWYLGVVAGIYSGIIKKDGILITLAGEVIIATPVATEVIAAVAVGIIVVSAVAQITC